MLCGCPVKVRGRRVVVFAFESKFGGEIVHCLEYIVGVVSFGWFGRGHFI